MPSEEGPKKSPNTSTRQERPCDECLYRSEKGNPSVPYARTLSRQIRRTCLYHASGCGMAMTVEWNRKQTCDERTCCSSYVQTSSPEDVARIESLAVGLHRQKIAI